MIQRDATGILLAGGRSSRMGRDKAALMVGGKPIVQRAADALRIVCTEVVVASGGRTLDLPALANLRHVPDPPGFAGPLAGLVAGMCAATSERVVVLACDMPFANPRVLAHLLGSLDGCDAAVPEFDGRPQPLQAAYSISCLAPAESLLRLGRNSMASLLDLVTTHFVSKSECARIDPAGLSGFNVNQPDDLIRARELLATMPSPTVA